ncbi:isochorismatase family protein [Arthrobacter sp. SDTb3-6]|uniref:cysteine hydrolase family protein n=1 Tax=Arthrobacter sp. SDTb3-6 TaxID=2713571 RepID=UPI001C3FF8C5
MSAGVPVRRRTLVAVDMQHCFRDKGSQWYVPRYDEIVPVIEALDKCLEGPAVFTMFVADPREPGAWSSYYDRWHEMRRPGAHSLWDITMAPPAGAAIVSKGTFSKWGPELEELIPVGSEMILTGVATDCCILSTALGAVDAGRFVTVVSDACAAVSDEAQAQTLALLQLLAPLCTVVTSTELLGVSPEISAPALQP